jgi:hypothetical protein
MVVEGGGGWPLLVVKLRNCREYMVLFLPGDHSRWL